MSAIALPLLIAASAASAQPQNVAPATASDWQPTAAYVTAGQDEPGYRAWYMAKPWRAEGVKAFNDYLAAWNVAGVVPTWQLLRTASDWQKCAAQPFEIAPAADWPNIVQTLRFIRDIVIPAVGPVEPVSAYRDPELNQCAGGAPESAHRYFQAVDLVPLRPTDRQILIHDLCDVHAREGERYAIGLGFYAFLRFHVDSRKFRKWGVSSEPEAERCANEPTSGVAAAPVADVSTPH